MTNTLASTSDLEGLPGAPFDSFAVDVAVAGVRADAGWHIAPVRTETIEVESRGGQLLIIPSRRIVSVSAVRRVGATTETLGSWRRTSGGLHRHWWPAGLLEVDLTHGYAKTPLELLPVIAEYARNMLDPRDPVVASRSVGQVSETYRDTGGTTTLHPTLANYAIPGGVA